MNFYYGVVENRSDPLKLGRCQVRVVGLHTHDKSQLPTSELPWATPMQPVVSAAMNGIGFTPVGPVEGTSVIIIFADEARQQPIMIGTLGGIPSAPGPIDSLDDSAISSGGNIENLQLRTIPGPVSGTQLEFYDPEYGSVNMTSPLKANMIVLGFGIPEGTFIVSVDTGTKITISNPVSNYGENIISFKSVPSNLEAVAQSKISGYVTDSSGNVVTSGDGQPVRTTTAPSSTTAAAVADTATNNSIPTIPPPKSSSNPSKASEGIKALIAACDKVGLTTKEQKCTLLGIAGGESGWIPQNESYNYSKGRIQQIFKFLTDDEAEKYSNAAKKGMSRQEFFSFIYGPTKRGKLFLGNITNEDGGKYYGRGFIQLTGRGNYKKYNDLANKMGLNIDILNNPDSLDNDINISAIVAALYIKDRTPAEVSPKAHPKYFFAAKDAVGINSPDIAAKKKSYYEYFYGQTPDVGGPEKDAAPPVAITPPAGNVTIPQPSPESLATGAATIGFRDPNSKYPLKNYIGEPDTNRLARGIIEGTVVKKKDATRKFGIPKALDAGKWDQPEAPFAAQYPFNKVYESESGHLQEFDDTPGFERLNTYHRSGTFTEIDSTGTQVNYIVGDSFTLMERNGCIHVAGECNITVDGNTNIYARTDANIQVDQNATVKVGNNLDIGAANDVYMAVGGDFKVKVAGNYQVQANNVSVKSDAALNIESAEDTNFLVGGTMSMDYSEGQFGNGAAGATAVELTPPPAGSPLNPTIPYTTQPERRFEERAAIETPEDYDTPEGRAASDQQSRTEGVVNAPPPVTTEEAPKPSGGTTTKIPVNCDIVYATKNYTDDFRLSKNFTLGMMIDGGVGGKHRLVDQMLKSTKDGPERLYTVQEIVCNLAQLTQNFMEPALEVLPGGIGGYLKQWRINSGYRLRGAIGAVESPISDHPKGLATDIGILLPDKYNKTYEIAQKLEKILPYDQIILEYRYPTTCWIHAAYRPENPRKMAFTMVNDKVYNINRFVLLDSIPPKAA